MSLRRPLCSSHPTGPIRPIRRGRVASLLLLANALGAAAIAPPLLAGEPAASPAPVVAPPVIASAAEPARKTALDAVIRRLERHLTMLRRARNELAAGRTEPLPSDEAARRRAEVDLRGVREVSRYEAGRTRALAALSDAEQAKDAAKIAEARGAIEAIDVKFVDAMRRLEESLEVVAKPVTGAADDAPRNSSKPAPKSARPGNDTDDDMDK